MTSLLSWRPITPAIVLRRDIFNNLIKQGSPPAWTQEAYRPPLIKYSMCCPVRGGGGIPWAGTPLAGVTPFQTWLGGVLWAGPPGWGTPLSWPGWGGTPWWAPPGYGTPILTWPGGTLGRHPLAGVPPTPHLDLARVPPPPTPGVDRFHENIAFPHPSDAVGNKASVAFFLNNVGAMASITFLFDSQPIKNSLNHDSVLT